MKPPSTPAAIARIELAMTRVENAQRELEYATQALSALRHGADLCTKAGKLRDACHSFFYMLGRAARGNHLGSKRDQMSLDSEPEARFPEPEPPPLGIKSMTLAEFGATARKKDR